MHPHQLQSKKDTELPFLIYTAEVWRLYVAPVWNPPIGGDIAIDSHMLVTFLLSHRCDTFVYVSQVLYRCLWDKTILSYISRCGTYDPKRYSIRVCVCVCVHGRLFVYVIRVCILGACRFNVCACAWKCSWSVLAHVFLYVWNRVTDWKGNIAMHFLIQ